MLMNNYTTEILKLEDVIITKVENTSDELHIYLELPRRSHICPACGAATDAVHDYRIQRIKDIPLGGPTCLHLRKRRYRCRECGKRFAEKNTFVPRYYRMTSRLIAAIINAFRSTVSATQIAHDFYVSASTSLRYFDCVNFPCPELPRVLSIDAFKGNAGGRKYQSILTDPENGQIRDILPNRYENDLIRYFSRFSSREKVEYFVTDMNEHFRRVAKICFPKAKIIADKFHVVRQACWAMERVRKNEQSRLSREYRRYFKRCRYLLFKKRENLKPEEMEQLALMFEIAPRLADAYRLKNEFCAIMKSGSSKEGRN